MTRTKILAAAAAILPLILVAAGTTFRDSGQDSPQPSQSDFDERWISIKSDRLPLLVPMSVGVATVQSDVTAPIEVRPQPLSLATEDDIRQAEAEHHRHRNICPHGRTYFTIEHHQYWRCKL
jgi:hypothetical protein